MTVALAVLATAVLCSLLVVGLLLARRDDDWPST